MLAVSEHAYAGEKHEDAPEGHEPEENFRELVIETRRVPVARELRGRRSADEDREDERDAFF